MCAPDTAANHQDVPTLNYSHQSKMGRNKGVWRCAVNGRTIVNNLKCKTKGTITDECIKM